MKNYLLLFMTIIMCIYGKAQPRQSGNAIFTLQGGNLKTIIPPLKTGKTTANDARLIAVARLVYRDSAFRLQDSTFFSYSGNNGYDYVTNGWKYDSMETWRYSTFTHTLNQTNKAYQQISGNRITSALFRRLSQTWEDSERHSYTYINGAIATELIEYKSGSGLVNGTKVANTYNNGLLVETLNEFWNSFTNQWVLYTRSVYSYSSNTSTDTITEEIQSYNTSKGQWYPNSRSIKGYVNGNLGFKLEQYSSVYGWINDARENYTYDASGNQLTFEREDWSGLTNSWQKGYREEYIFNNANDLTTIVSLTWQNGSWANGWQTLYTYNQDHQVLTEEHQTWDGTTTAGQWTHIPGNMLNFYYYEGYTNGIQDAVPRNDAELTLYPDPAKDEINMILNLKESRVIVVTIFNMAGKVMQRWRDRAGTQYHKTVDLSAMPAGNYIIEVTDSTERAIKTISIVR